MNTKKILTTAIYAIIMSSCMQNGKDRILPYVTDGEMSVSVKYDDAMTKSTTDYITALDAEKSVKKIDVLVFDKSTGALNSVKSLNKMEDNCTFTLPTGEKTIYAIINGPDLSRITNISMLANLTDDLTKKDMTTSGLTLIGSTDCTVVKEFEAKPVIKVRWLVARVVLNKIICNIPAQYGMMQVDCVYLGNANMVQEFSGNTSVMVNPDGYEDNDKTKPIGQNTIIGSCPDYLYRQVNMEIPTGGFSDTKFHMYCQPNQTDDYTCLFLMTSIGDSRYYYRVPLDLGLTANSTCSVELKITNLGSPNPPVGNYESNTVTANISIEGWTAGNSYVAEF